MSRSKNQLCIAAAFVVLAVIGTIMNSRQVAAQGPPGGIEVRIVNPLPMPVGNTSSNPLVVRDIDNPARHEFKQLIALGGANPSFHQITVPPGKRYVIEYVSARGCVAPGQVPELLIFETASSVALAAYRFASAGSVNGMGGLNCFAFNQQMRAYVDPGSLLTVAYNGTTASTTDFQITVSGYALDIP